MGGNVALIGREFTIRLGRVVLLQLQFVGKIKETPANAYFYSQKKSLPTGSGMQRCFVYTYMKRRNDRLQVVGLA